MVNNCFSRFAPRLKLNHNNKYKDKIIWIKGYKYSIIYIKLGPAQINTSKKRRASVHIHSCTDGLCGGFSLKGFDHWADSNCKIGVGLGELQLHTASLLRTTLHHLASKQSNKNHLLK